MLVHESNTKYTAGNHFLFVFLTTILSNYSCNEKQTQKSSQAASEKKFTEIPGWTGIFQDTLPCADCPGLLTWLEIRQDGYYKRISTRIGEADVFAHTRSTLARWKFDSEYQMIVLDSATEKAYMAFTPQNDSTLIACDSKGKPLENARWKIRRRKGGDGLPAKNPG
jgi:hypothetical protein